MSVRGILPLRGGEDRGAGGAGVGRQLQLQHLPKLGWLVAYYPDDGSVRITGETAATSGATA